MTAYAIYGLLETKAAGYKVAGGSASRIGLTALARLYRKYPRAIPALKAYMVYVLSAPPRAISKPATSRTARSI